MAQAITMPALSPTMTEGKLARWLKNEGDSIEIGDILAEIETDKATMEVEAVEEGRLGKKVVADNTDNVAVNQTIGVLLEEGDEASAIDQILSGSGAAPAASEGGAAGDGGSAGQGSGAGEASAASPSAAQQPAASGGGSATTPPVDRTGPAPPAPRTASGERVLATPLARRLAKARGLDLIQVKGSGPHGRIVRADVEAAEVPAKTAAEAPHAAPATSAPEAAPAAQPAQPTPAKQIADQLGMAYEEIQLSNMRKTIAQRLQESKQTIPHYYLTIDVKLDKLLATRKELNARSDGSYKLSVNDFIIRAVALALKDVPQANTAWNGQSMLQFKHADVAVAVAIEAGLITPIIKQAETKGLAQISSEMKDLAGRARDGKLKPEEYQGGTFSISNLGMFGIREFSAIINPPQSGILAIGAGEQRPIVGSDGELTTATMMTCTLSADHRTVDGAIGAQFLSAFRAKVEEPLSMLL